MFKKIINFVKKVAIVALRTIREAIVDLVSNFEATIILCLATLGTSALISQYSYTIALPAIIEAPMVVPVISVILISTLILSIHWRLRC